MDGAEVGILKETHQVGLTSLLKGHHSRTLESQVGLEVLSNLSDETLERQLADEQFSGLLVPGRGFKSFTLDNPDPLPPDLAKSNGARPIAVGLLHSTCGRSTLPGCLTFSWESNLGISHKYVPWWQVACEELCLQLTCEQFAWFLP